MSNLATIRLGFLCLAGLEVYGQHGKKCHFLFATIQFHHGIPLYKTCTSLDDLSCVLFGSLTSALRIFTRFKGIVWIIYTMWDRSLLQLVFTEKTVEEQYARVLNERTIKITIITNRSILCARRKSSSLGFINNLPLTNYSLLTELSRGIRRYCWQSLSSVQS